MNIELPQQAPRRYRDVSGTLVLEDTRFPQVQQIFLQSRTLLPSVYPDVHVNSAWTIRTIYPTIVPCMLSERNEDYVRENGWAYRALQFHLLRQIHVETTLEQFLQETFKDHMDHVWDYEITVGPGKHKWFRQDDTLDDVLQMEYKQNVVHPAKSEKVWIFFQKRPDNELRVCNMVPCQMNPESRHMTVAAVRKHLEGFKDNVPLVLKMCGFVEQWLPDSGIKWLWDDSPQHLRWCLRYMRIFWRWFQHIEPINSEVKLFQLVKGIMHYGP